MNRLRLLLVRLRASLWFIPTLVVLGSVALALALIETQGWVGDDLAKRWPRLLGAGADGSRDMLSSIATSMITVAGVVFSITIVALSLTSTQYSPRVLRNFMRDRPTQLVLGIFVGIFAYCLVVLRTVRSTDASDFVPSLAVLVGMAYAFVGIGFLIYFIHHVAQSIQSSSIVSRIFSDTAEAVDQLYPEGLGQAPEETAHGQLQLPGTWTAVRAQRSGYITSVDSDGLMAFAVEHKRVLRLGAATGEFIVEGCPLAELGGPVAVNEDIAGKLHGLISLGQQRTVEQDAAFGLQQLVDVAVRALSPGINDPTTACMCIDQLSALMYRLASRDIPDPRRIKDGQLRVIAPAPDFADYVGLAFRGIVHHSRGDVQVTNRLLDALQVVARAVRAPDRLDCLAAIARAIDDELACVTPASRAEPSRRRAQQVAQMLLRSLA